MTTWPMDPPPSAHVASGANYAGITGNVTATEDDDDTGFFVFSPPSVNVPEDGDATYNLSALSHQPSSNVTVAYCEENRSGSEYHRKPRQPHLHQHHLEHWPNRDRRGCFRYLMVSMAPPPSATPLSGAEYAGVTGDVTATEQDTDRKLVTSTSSVTVDEGSSATYTVRLATQPTGIVTVAVTWLQGDADLSVTPASLSFTTGNWNTDADRHRLRGRSGQ